MTDPTQPEKRWRGHTHKELYQLLHDGPGAGASAEPSRRWAEISASLSEIGQDLQKALEQSGAAWSGKAAGRAYDRLSTTAAWATETSAAAAAMRAAVENQAEHIAKARADMPAPEDVPATQPDPTAAPAVQVAQSQTDLENPEATASSAEERAFEVMAAYEANTTTITSSMASFAEPPALVQRDEVHRGNGIGHQDTSPSGAGGWGPPSRHDDHHHRPWHGGAGGGGGGDRWGPSTSGSSAPWVDRPVPRGPAPAPTSAGPAPGGFGAAPMGPFVGSGSDDRQRSSGRSSGGSSGGSAGAVPGGVNGSSGSGGSGAGSSPKVGAGGMPTADFHAAAASQAAAAAHQAGAPMAPAGGAPMGQQDKMAMRRFGMEAIGSSQWFGDTEEPVVGQGRRQRRNFRESDEVTESVDVLGEEHKLPPNVIGDGPTNR